jgi:hypothetical protein
LTELKQYDLENTIVNNLPRFNQLVPSSDIRIMELNLRQPSDTCKTYRTCNEDANNTNTLPNRVLTQTFYYVNEDKPYVKPSTISPYR